jgi:Peptidase family M28
MKRLAALTAFSLLLAGFALAGAAAPPLPSQDDMQNIRPEAIKAHMQFLSDDLLEGRETGTRGYELAANYIRSQFQEIGLKPGANDSYFQQVPLRRTRLDADKCSFVLKQNGTETKLAYDQTFAMRGNAVYEDTSIEAPVIFVGYGVSAPELQHDDYAGIDVKGKVVAALYGAPSTFPSAERAHFSPTDQKEKMAAAHGAVGFISIWAGEREKTTSFTRFMGFLRLPGMRWLDAQGKPSDVEPSIRGEAYLGPEGARQLFRGAPKSFDEVVAQEKTGKLPVLALPTTVAIRQVSNWEQVKSPNVIGVLPGSDPKLKDEYVLYTAHADHLGVGRAVKGDTIYNGALDNASGTAALIELAHAFATAPEPPKRSIMFLAVTGEEEGLLGSDYFANFPTVPISQVVANLNMDELPMVFDFKDVVALGAEHSSLGSLVEAAAKREGLEMSPDPMPEENFFVRSDQYSLVLKGVPSIYIGGGEKAVDPKINGAKVGRDWIKSYYHTPQDDMSQKFDYGAAAKCTRLNFAVGYAVANMAEKPFWNPGDYFGTKFGQPKQTSGQH